jgi:hypothetical protein
MVFAGMGPGSSPSFLSLGRVGRRYLALVRSGGICQDVYEEVAALQRLRFDFRDKQVGEYDVFQRGQNRASRNLKIPSIHTSTVCGWGGRVGKEGQGCHALVTL